MANEYYSMSITSLGPCSIPNRELPIIWQSQKATNDISDIEGARPKVLHKTLFKPQFTSDDVPGSTSKLLHHGRNTRDLTLYIDDIEGTRHRVRNKMLTSNRRVNPLDPQYSLPFYEHAPIDPPKFVKCSLDHSDIEKSTPKVAKVTTTRDTMKLDDIEGTSVGWKPSHELVRKQNQAHEIMQVQDISYKDHRWVDRAGQNRMSDTLDPAYLFHGMVISDDARYTKPKPSKGLIPENNILKTQDINHPPEKVPPPRREYRNINFIADIEGAQHDTIRPGIITKRQTNPLNPLYQSLDDGELIPPVVQPLIPPERVLMPTLKPPRDPHLTPTTGGGGNGGPPATTSSLFGRSNRGSGPNTQRAASSPRMGGGNAGIFGQSSSSSSSSSSMSPSSPQSNSPLPSSSLSRGSSNPRLSPMVTTSGRNERGSERGGGGGNEGSYYSGPIVPPLPLGVADYGNHFLQQQQQDQMNNSTSPSEPFHFYKSSSNQPSGRLFSPQTSFSPSNTYPNPSPSPNPFVNTSDPFKTAYPFSSSSSSSSNPTLALNQFNSSVSKGNHHHPPPQPSSRTLPTGDTMDLIPGKVRDMYAGGVPLGQKAGQRERDREISKQQQRELRRERVKEHEALQKDIDAVRQLM